MAGPHSPVPTVLHVEDLSYSFLPNILERYGNSLLDVFGKARNKLLGSGRKKSEHFLPKVSFRADPGKITGIIGDSKTSRKALIDLICGHRKYGVFSGQIYASNESDIATSMAGAGKYKDTKFAYYNMLGFVPRKSLHLAGLTYLEMVEYSARLQLLSNAITAKDRALEALQVVGLADKAYNRIPEEYSSRGKFLCIIALLKYR